MAVLDIQRRGQQIGRIRIGQQVRASNGKSHPSRLDTFRFTTGSRACAEAICALYGGEVRDWQGEYEVITAKSEIGVTVPPRDEVISQWYEMWNKGGCLRRCDSQHEQISGGPCLCPRDPKERSALAAENPPQACKLVTRISVMIPDLPGLGVFRLDTGSYYAATEIGDSANLMQVARDRGVFLPAILRIEQRSRVAGGQTKKYPVPVLEVLATFRDLATGAIERAGMAAQLPPAPGVQPRAIEAGSAPTAPPAASPAPAPEPEGFAAVLAGIRAAEPAVAAQRIANAAMTDRTANEMRALVALAKELEVIDDSVCTDEEDDIYEVLSDYLAHRWQELAHAAKARGAR